MHYISTETFSEGKIMERAYWLTRKRASMSMARGAATASSRLIHYELAGRYSVKAATAEQPQLHAPSPDFRDLPLEPGRAIDLPISERS